MSKAYLDRFEDWIDTLARDSYRDWLMFEVLPAQRKREAGQAAVSRRWRDHESKPDHIKRREHRGRQERYRERKSIVEQNMETIAARPEVIKIEPIHIPNKAGAFTDEHVRLIREEGWRHEIHDDNSGTLHPPRIMAPAPVQSAAPAAQAASKLDPKGVVCRDALYRQITKDEWRDINESGAWPRAETLVNTWARLVDYDDSKLMRVARHILAQVRAGLVYTGNPELGYKQAAWAPKPAFADEQ